MKLADQQARDRFIGELDRNFCVAASAGAGKTTAIVRRIAAFAREHGAQEPPADGEDPFAQLVVVTYGVLAAEELRVRARQEIFKALPGGGAKRQRLLARFCRSFFGTIHSFCLNLLRQEGARLGLPSTIDLLEEGDESLWFRFIEDEKRFTVDLPEARLEAVLRHMTLDQLLSLAKQFSPEEAEKELGSRDPGPAPVPDFSETLVAEGKGRAAEKIEADQAELREWLADFKAGAPYLPLPGPTSSSKAFVEAYKAELAPLQRWLEKEAGRLAARIALSYRDYRLQERRLTYDDMVAWTARLIDDPDVLRRLRRRGYIIILDEAQDTDHAMFRILTELTRPEEVPAYAWPDEEGAPGPEAGRFSFVGDDQQGIYSSRADLAVYRKYVDAYTRGSGGERLEFSVTMRCPVAVVDAVNRVFPGRIRQQHAEFRRLNPRPDARAGAVLGVAVPVPEEKLKVGEQFALECRTVAGQLASWGKKGLGVGSWSDVAILCPRVSWLQEASRHLAEADIPVRQISSQQQRRFLPAYSWPVALLHVLVRPDDRFELIGVLRELFGVSDKVLAGAQRNGGLSLESRTKDARLGNALKTLGKLREGLAEAAEGKDGRVTRLGEQVEGIFKEVFLEDRLRAIGEDPRPLVGLCWRARAAEAEGQALEDFAAQLMGELELAPPADGGGDGEAVQLLTSYKSKGLEYEVVVLLGLGRAIGEAGSSYPALARGSGGDLKIHLSNVTVDEENREFVRLAKHQEYQRLFYVTMTRAKRLLVLPSTGDLYRSSKGELSEASFLGMLRWEEIAEALGGETTPPVVDEVRGNKIRVGDHEVELPLLEEAAAASRAGVRRLLPHELAHDNAVRLDVLEAPSGPSVGGVDYGTRWHEIMEVFPWKADDREEAVFWAEILAGLPVDDPALCRRAEVEIALWRTSEVRRRLKDEGMDFRCELPFSFARSEHEWIEGVIDLVVVRKDGGCVVLDWKTNRIRKGESKEDFRKRLADQYAPQLRAYADVIARGGRVEVAGLWLYATATGEEIKLEV